MQLKEAVDKVLEVDGMRTAMIQQIDPTGARKNEAKKTKKPVKAKTRTDALEKYEMIWTFALKSPLGLYVNTVMQSASITTT
jgi:hypothetical protein